jgi:hypothetical protein
MVHNPQTQQMTFDASFDLLLLQRVDIGPYCEYCDDGFNLVVKQLYKFCSTI